MPNESDIQFCAELLIEQHGPGSQKLAFGLCDERWEAGQGDSAKFWAKVAEKIGRLVPPGGTVR